MKLLAVSDAADPGLWDYFTKDKLEGVDAILSCGDLPSGYLTFLVTMGNIPVFYVHGSHDARYEQQPPEGCRCMDGELLDKFHPLYHCCGHIHLEYAPTRPRVLQYGGTSLVNVSGKYLVELPDRAEPPGRWRRGQ